MNLEGISNLFNIISLSHPSLNYYHYGWTSDIDSNIPNNFTQGATENNTRGKKYPSLHLDFPAEKWNLGKKDALVDSTGWLIFNDAQYYKSEDGTTDPRSILEVQKDLQKIGLDVLTEFNRLGRELAKVAPNMQAQIKSVNEVRYTANARADRLVEMLVNVTIEYKLECSDFVANIPALTPPFNSFPPLSGDYELKTNE